jgi:hypothetical protein
MKRLIITAILLIAATALFAVARQDTKPATMPGMQGMMTNGHMMGNSPMNIPGVEVAVEDTPDGINVSFTTKTGDVAELRRLVRQHMDMMKAMKKPASK